MAGSDSGALPDEARIGLGRDRHPFGPEDGLRLGGLELPEVPRLYGHSDGDVVLHAVADALLGAVALGDLGRMAPADERTPRGIASSALLERTVSRLADAGWRPAQVDILVVAGRPQLAGHLDAIRRTLAALLGLPPGDVSVRASSGNLLGPEGEGRAIAAEAVAVVVPRSPGGDVGDPG
jgi:2-C-methyl-D-erythritol 2,4-cyclodiphosphate synthase